MADIAGVQLLRDGRQTEASVDLTVRKQLGRRRRSAGDPADVVGGVETDMGGHDRNEQVFARAERLDNDGLALEVGNAANAGIAEQLQAADMDAAQNS